MGRSILDDQICLKLNSAWQRLGYCSPREAIVAMTGEVEGGTPPALAMDIEVDAEGKLISSVPTKWDDWINLPVRTSDLAISSSFKAIRCPVVLLIPSYDQMPVKAPKLTSRAILERDGYVDQYTGERLTKAQASVDHVIPRDRGGKDTWYNLVCCEKKRNHAKSNKLNREIGLRLLKKPHAPRPIPVSEYVKEARHPHHLPFIV